MVINKAKIQLLKPCNDRFGNFNNKYPNWSGPIAEFLDLQDISYNDKIWVCTRLMTTNQLVHWSIFCAESTADIFNKTFPNNNSVNNLLAFLKTIVDFTTMSDANKAILQNLRGKVRNAYADATDTYATDTYAAYAYAAAYATAATAANAAYAAATAADATYAAYAAAATAGEEKQRNLNLLFLASLIEEQKWTNQIAHKTF